MYIIIVKTDTFSTILGVTPTIEEAKVWLDEEMESELNANMPYECHLLKLDGNNRVSYDESILGGWSPTHQEWVL